jgi:hypothetical protein
MVCDFFFETVILLSARGLLDAQQIPLGILNLDEPTHRGYFTLGHYNLASMGRDCLGGGVNILDIDGAFKTIDMLPWNHLVALLQGAGETWMLLVARLDQEKPGRSPGPEFPSKHPLVKALGARQIIGMNGEETQIARHVGPRNRIRQD